MDPRVTRHAELLTEHCTSIEPGDNVLVNAPAAASELVVALYEQIGSRGGRPMCVWRNPRARRAYLRAVELDAVGTNEHELAAMGQTDVAILIKAGRNATETSDVPPEAGAAVSRATEPILAERLDTRWVISQHPTAADAQRAGMSTAGWADYVYDAVLRDWAAQRRHQRRVADVLEDGADVRIVAGERTDLRLSIAGMGAYNDDGTENMPGGEVATSPVVDSVEGTLAVDFPVRRQGRELTGVWLEFEAGEVVAYGAAKNEAVLEQLLETDAGARRVGELGIGMNRGIDRVSRNILFDEKMGDTVHVALGQGIETCVPDDRALNESAIHQDLLVAMDDDARIEVDGEVIQRDGTFWFETGG